MEFCGIDDFMRYLKGKYDDSDKKQTWRALSGRDHVGSSHDTFIFTDQKIFQIKAAEVIPQSMVAVASEVGTPSSDLLDLIRTGSPVPLNVFSGVPAKQAVVMFGVQQYSSEITDLLKREYFHSRQDALRSDLDRKLSAIVERPEFKHAYRSLKERQETYFA